MPGCEIFVYSLKYCECAEKRGDRLGLSFSMMENDIDNTVQIEQNICVFTCKWDKMRGKCVRDRYHREFKQTKLHSFKILTIFSHSASTPLECRDKDDADYCECLNAEDEGRMTINPSRRIVRRAIISPKEGNCPKSYCSWSRASGVCQPNFGLAIVHECETFDDGEYCGCVAQEIARKKRESCSYWRPWTCI